MDATMDTVLDADAKGFVEGLEKCFADLEDPRVQGRCDHLLFDIVSMVLLGSLCGAEDWPDFEEFGKRREKWLRTFLELPEGIPSHDTFRRVFGMLDRKQFAASLFQWTQALQEATGGKIVSIDGKTVRRSSRKKSGAPPLHVVSAWASENSLTLGQTCCEEKSNEITAIPELLKLLSLKGCTVTIDAMGCQKEIAEEIREREGHYLLGLKGNQPTLENDMQQLYEEGLNSDFADLKHTQHETHEDGHGRHEHRTCHAIEIPKDHPQRDLWPDLRTLVVVNSCRKIDDEETWESRWYVSSDVPDAEKLGHAIRKHWSIENTLHWSLDVTFGEDARRQHDRAGAANLGAVRRFALSLLRQEKTNKRGLKNKRLACAWDPQYLLKVLNPTQF